MSEKSIYASLREQHNLTQEEMAQRLFVTRQAVSRWETGETTPNTETLKLISATFNVSINTLLGAPQSLICQCCSMPLYEDEVISRELDGSFNEDYCRWCYAEGTFAYDSLDVLMAFLVPHLAKMHGKNEAEIQAFLEAQLPKLKHWQA